MRSTFLRSMTSMRRSLRMHIRSTQHTQSRAAPYKGVDDDVQTVAIKTTLIASRSFPKKQFITSQRLFSITKMRSLPHAKGEELDPRICGFPVFLFRSIRVLKLLQGSRSNQVITPKNRKVRFFTVAAIITAIIAATLYFTKPETIWS